ncbi:UvrD-helicase domain-containing protein [Pallidibacillus thermolactis]|jgi:DNA helicase II / ATP-dependent DNA helicase PcrA|uniref:UvrD-helicase domain-containing protein n=1 Tax=Pallidibacillus thermolactis TaxID=251051 RepID=UPI0021DAA266|nr:ATP-dependent helicase [Pallidibacillus thermolactis]MCU9599897.1 ATP-dependent helicase [Pallidibacillus thermolactis subsp. kokeshiiformis]
MDLSTAKKLKSSKDSIPIDVHFQLCAGPGAGKTTFLINHIKRILSESTRLSKARRIACITYTNTGIDTIKERLKDTAEDVEVSTIHSFLYKHIVKPYLWVLKKITFPIEKMDGHDEFIPGFTILSEYKQRSKQQWIDDHQALANALTKLSWIINDNREIELNFLKPFYGKVQGRNIKKNSYLTYKQICWERGLMSHDDVLYFSYLILKQNEDIRNIIRAKFPYFLIDEFQDTSPLQVEIIKLIAEKETVVGVIGDPCQSIFSFQGADENTFNQFYLDGMSFYVLENNHRSTKQIITVLNRMRNDVNFIQYSPDEKSGNKPILLIGDSFDAYYRFLSELENEKDWCILAYKNDVINSIKFDIPDFESDEFDLYYRDKERGKLIYHIIHAIEYGRQMKLKDALKFMKKAFRKIDNFTDRDSIRKLNNLLSNYETISSLNIKEFYNTYIYNFHGIKSKISSGAINEFYESLTYKEVAALVNITDDRSSYKTIHKAKGEEFNNVLVVVPKEENYKELDFLLSPNMKKEEHRVFYVALSRAKEKLYINIPSISKEEADILEDFDRVYLDSKMSIKELVN